MIQSDRKTLALPFVKRALRAARDPGREEGQAAALNLKTKYLEVELFQLQPALEKADKILIQKKQAAECLWTRVNAEHDACKQETTPADQYNTRAIAAQNQITGFPVHAGAAMRAT